MKTMLKQYRKKTGEGPEFKEDPRGGRGVGGREGVGREEGDKEEEVEEEEEEPEVRRRRNRRETTTITITTQGQGNASNRTEERLEEDHRGARFESQGEPPTKAEAGGRSKKWWALLSPSSRRGRVCET